MGRGLWLGAWGWGGWLWEGESRTLWLALLPFSCVTVLLSAGNRAHFVYGIACDHGCIWDLKFCPSGAWELPSTPRKVHPIGYRQPSELGPRAVVISSL